ncbi:hypothetical protein WJX77_004829 [Trebouxia sp. C0004]
MSATDLASSHLLSEWADTDLYEPGASSFGSRYKRIARSKSSVSAAASRSGSTLKVVKLEVKAPTAGRSGLLAAQLKGSPSPSSPSSLSASIESSSRKRNVKLDSPKATLATVDELSSASVESATSNARLPVPVSPSSGNTSPLAVPAKRQNTNSWGIRPATEDEFVPPHLMSAQTLPSDFVYAEDARPGSVLEGIGRKLRGSDAIRFRESVMRQTGFLEPQSLQHKPAD